MLLIAARIAGFVITIRLWQAVMRADLARSQQLAVVIGAVLLVFPVTSLGRKALDRRATTGGVAWATTVVHLVLMILFGASIIEAIELFHARPGIPLPVPTTAGFALLCVTGACLGLTVVNLALTGLGAPFAIAPSRRVASRWMYRWTRNPMVLCALLTLLSAGLYLQSLGFVLWVVLLVGPAWAYFLKAFEERELEIRFGPSYADYRAATPFLWPRRPRTRC